MGDFSMLAPNTPTATKSFDNRHLSIEFKGHTDVEPFSLYLVFDESTQTWKGTWSACNKDPGDAVLRRPHFVRSNTNVMVGDWNSRPNPNGKFYTAGSLHFRQTSDGLLIAWMDRAFAPGRNGGHRSATRARGTRDAVRFWRYVHIFRHHFLGRETT